MHTPLCKHAFGEPGDYAERAEEIGLDAIVFTCHSPMPDGFWPRVRMDVDQFDSYCDMVGAAAEAFEGRIDVGLGIESDWFPGMEGWLEELHGKVDLDHVIGSVHYFGPEYTSRFQAQDVHDFSKIYFDNLVASAETGLFDTLAHPDLVKNMALEEWDFERISDHIGQSLDAIAETGVAMELNTSGLNKPMGEMNPGDEMLTMMAARDIPLVIGSDAHVPERVGADFDLALDLAEGAGYADVQMMWGRCRQPISIQDVRSRLFVPQALTEFD